jgi:glycine dehydrogenase subunit 1
MTIPYIPNTVEDRQAMLAAIGVASVDELFADIPPEFRIGGLDLPPPLSEPELVRELTALAQRNQPVDSMPCFLGAGAYRHFIPGVVSEVIGRSEYATAYTPYQAEISQGTLQTAFEFQSMVCELTAMEVANAGMYDGASALAEACLMAAGVTGRRRIALFSSLHPHYQATVRTYAFGRGLAVDVVAPDGSALNEEHACLAVQQPNFFGHFLPEVEALEKAVHERGALFVVAVDPISLGLFRPPGEYGADVALGEGQSLGSPLNFGGPYLGLFACRQQYVRQMPGRIVGRTSDAQGRTGYVLTLQTREQHIRRERATSNICTSQQLVALAATVYLAAMGKQGLRQVAELCYHKAHYAAQRIARLPGYSPAFEEPFFKEFVVRCLRPPSEVNRALLGRGIIGGLDVSEHVENGLLLCVTEMNARREIEALVEALAEIGGAA